VTNHPGVDAVVFLGLGIQGNQGRLEREGPFFPGYGLDRIVAYHDRQERRYAHTAAALAEGTGKPVLATTELALGDATNPAVAGVRESGRLCYPSADRAVTALAHLWRYARWRRRRGL
jgi:acetyltransferase